MAQSSMGQMRAWRGPVLFSYGFRPFFLFAGVWAVLSMLLWIAMLAGALDLPTRFDPTSWHAHAFLFGYLSAVLAGFLLTAVPNWTGRLPLVGWPLIGLSALWVAGRIAVLISALLPQGLAAVIDLSFLLILGGVVLREILAGKNWRNLMVLGLLAAFTLANALFHLEAARHAYAAQGMGLRLGLATAIMMIAVIGGRIIPSFTRNWLVQSYGKSGLPVPPMQRFDKLVLLITLACLLIWVASPDSGIAGVGLLAIGVLHLLRLTRWRGDRTFAEPLVLVLHLSYAFIPLGAFMMGLATIGDGTRIIAAQHLWMAGGIGGMTLAVMTRATLGHTGRSLRANRMTMLIYGTLFGSVLARFLSGSGAELSGLLWIASYCGFVCCYGPYLLRSKPAGGRP